MQNECIERFNGRFRDECLSDNVQEEQSFAQALFPALTGIALFTTDWVP